MAETTKTSLVVRRVFEASPQKLWELCTDPEKVKQWHHPPGFTTAVAETDVRVGGKWKIGMRNPKGEMSTAYGEFIEVDEPNKLVFSWQWENGPSEEVSQVTIEFLAHDDDTEMVLTHEKLSSAESVKLHLGGWESMLPTLEELTKT